MTHHATRQLAEFVVSTSLSHMPGEVVDRAKYFVLDHVTYRIMWYQGGERIERRRLMGFLHHMIRGR